MHNSQGKMQYRVAAFCSLVFCFLFFTGCSNLNMESQACSEARTEAKRFYSLHLANDMRPSQEYRNLRKSFFTAEMSRRLEDEDRFQSVDAFTGVGNDDKGGYPRTFKIGRCVGGDSDPDNDVFLQVQLYWYREQYREKEVIQVDRTLEMVRQSDKWAIAATDDGYRR